MSVTRYQQIQDAKRAIRDRHPEARFLNLDRLRRQYPHHYRELGRAAEGHGVRLSDCLFYDTPEGVSVAFPVDGSDEDDGR